MQFDGGNGGVDTRPPALDQTAHYSFEPAQHAYEPASQAGWWEHRDRQPAALWILLGGAVVAGILLLVAFLALRSSGETVTGAGEDSSGADSALASPTADADPAASETSAQAETGAAPTADNSTGTAGGTTADATEDDGSGDEQPDTLAVTGTPDGATAPATPGDTATTVQATTTTAAPTTQAPTTVPPTTEPETTEAPTTQPPATDPPATEAPTTEPPATDPPTTPAPSTAAPTTQPPAADAPTTTATTMPPATEAPTTQPPATEPPPTAAPPAGNDAAAQQQVLDLTNAERANAGCPALQLNQQLNQAADGHSEDMAARNYFDHNDPEGNGPGVRIDAVGYQGRGWGENIAAGYRTAAAVVEGWMNSDGHRRNILNCNFNELGVGYAEGGSYGVYWTQVFGTR